MCLEPSTQVCSWIWWHCSFRSNPYIVESHCWPLQCIFMLSLSLSLHSICSRVAPVHYWVYSVSVCLSNSMIGWNPDCECLCFQCCTSPKNKHLNGLIPLKLFYLSFKFLAQTFRENLQEFLLHINIELGR